LSQRPARGAVARPFRNRRSRLAAAGLARRLLLAGAFGFGCVTPAPSGAWRPALEDRRQVEAWLVRARDEMALRHSIRASGRLRIDSGRGKGTVRAVVLAQLPDRLRLETLNLLGQTQTLLVVDGDAFAFFGGGAVERGLTDREVLRLRLGLDLEPSEAIALLLAAPDIPAQPPQKIWAASGGAAAGEHRVEFATRSVSFASDGELREVRSIDGGGQLRWQAQFGGWRDVTGGRYPSQVNFEFPDTGLSAKLSIETAELNPDLDARLFRVGDEPGD
jgi:outer membrane biogenesis lipoprotein LolB